MQDYPNAGNYGARPGRRPSKIREMTDAEIAERSQLRGVPLPERKRHQLREVCNNCLADEAPGTYESGREKVARIVAEEMRLNDPHATCSHMTITNAIRGYPIRARYRAAILSVLPRLVLAYCPHLLEIDATPVAIESLDFEDKIRLLFPGIREPFLQFLLASRHLYESQK